MKPKKRQKLCHNCDGEIDLDVIVCPYCAADLRSGKSEYSSMPLMNPSSSSSMEEPVSRERATVTDEKVEEKPLQSSSSMATPLLLLTAGTHLLVLGILLVLLSHHGSVTLHWDARMWFIYIFASIPFLIFGYRSIK